MLYLYFNILYTPLFTLLYTPLHIPYLYAMPCITHFNLPVG